MNSIDLTPNDWDLREGPSHADPESVAEGLGPVSPVGQEAPCAERVYCLTEDEWEGLEDAAMSFHGVVRLVEDRGFDSATGARELLDLAYRDLESRLHRIRSRVQCGDDA